MKKCVKLLSLLLATAGFVSATGCSGGGVEKFDETKTQLFVSNFDGGFGSIWLRTAADRFEELHKNDRYEEGKTGVEIIISTDKSLYDQIKPTILKNREEVFIRESVDCENVRNEIGLELTDVVTNDLTEYGESVSIEDKMTAEQSAYLKGNGSYYCIPHYTGLFGIQYNIELFDQYGFYFAKTPVGTSLDGKFVSRANPIKSAGPDGTEGTWDDGLPTTYEEFFLLCDYVNSVNLVPVAWAGETYQVYMQLMEAALAADADGLEQSMLTVNLNGTANTLGTVQNGKFVYDEEPTLITPENGYELARQAGRYYALQFMHKLFKTEKYRHELVFNTGYTFTSVQEDFLFGGIDGVTTPIAMMLEGNWWVSESTYTFNAMAQEYGGEYSKENRNFGIMPFPKPTKEMAESNNGTTLVRAVDSHMFIKKNIPTYKIDLAKDFLRFLNTDQSLVEFSEITSTKKSLNYDMTTEQLNKMTPYGRNLWRYTANADYFYPATYTSEYINYRTTLDPITWFKTKYDGVVRDCVVAMHDTNTAADTLFSGLYTYKKDSWFN